MLRLVSDPLKIICQLRKDTGISSFKLQFIIKLVLLHFHFSVNNAAFEDILSDTFYFCCPSDGFLGRPEGRIFPGV